MSSPQVVASPPTPVSVDGDGPTLRTVAEQAGIALLPHDGVTVDDEVLAAVARRIAVRVAGAPSPAKWDDPRFWPVEAARSTRIQILAIGNAINFRFWRRTDGAVEPMGGRIEGEWLVGSMYMWRRLTTRLREGRFPVHLAEFWASGTERLLADVFADDEGLNPLVEGLDERTANLADLGSQLIGHWAGEFENVCLASRSGLARFLGLSQAFRAFDDPVKKLALVNAIMLQGSGLADFTGAMLPAIDYQLMKQLLRFGVLVPEPTLAEKLASAAYLTTDESMSLRRSSMAALIRISEVSGVDGGLLDNLLWHNRTICRDSEPLCGQCAFRAPCRQLTGMGRPLEITRYY